MDTRVGLLGLEQPRENMASDISRVIDREVDKIAQRVDICLALVLLRLFMIIKVLCLLFWN